MRYVLALLLVLGSAACDSEEKPRFDPAGTYHLQTPAERWYLPAGLGDVLGPHVPDLLFEVETSAQYPGRLQLLGAGADPGPPVTQDLCRRTGEPPVVWLDADRVFTVDDVDLPAAVGLDQVSLHGLTVAGRFTPDATAFVNSWIRVTLDARELAPRAGTDATALCARAAAGLVDCEPCPGDGAVFCFGAMAQDLVAPRMDGLDVVPVEWESAPARCVPGNPDCGLVPALETYAAGLFNGYTLYASLHDTVTELIDICGTVVHRWHTSSSPAHASYLLDDGRLLRAAATGNTDFNPTSTGGVVELLDPDGSVYWRYEYCDAQRCAHHDIEPMPNGNVLVVAWEKKTAAEAIAAGRDPALLSAGELWPDHIVEVEPVLPEGGTVVWEWHLWDHLVQDFDPAQANYGAVADHPERFDINGPRDVVGQPLAGADFSHINAIAYHPGLDQVLISSPTSNEILVIDHSTSTAEAAGSTGGRYGRGGDFLYRWGNPRIYGAGTLTDQQLFGQHSAHWIPPGLPGAGNVLLFNNGTGRLFSTVDELTLPADATGFYPLTHGGAWGPDSLVWTFVADPPEDLWASVVSGAQRLPNGNTLVCDGPADYFFEVTQAGREVWRFRAPVGVYFRATRYAPDHPGVVALLP